MRRREGDSRPLTPAERIAMWDRIILGYGLCAPGPYNTIRVMKSYGQSMEDIVRVLRYYHGLLDDQIREALRDYAKNHDE